MKVSSAFPSKYLKVEDLDDQDLTLTISRVTIEELGLGDEKTQKLIVYFYEVEKGLACNKTNANVIAKLYGDETADWTGKQITLWPNHDVAFKGEIVSAIRVRSRAPRPVGASAQSIVDTWSYPQAVAEAEKRGITEKAMKGYLKTKGFAGYNSVPCTPVLREWFTKLEPPKGTGDDEVIFDQDAPDPTDSDAPPF